MPSGNAIGRPSQGAYGLAKLHKEKRAHEWAGAASTPRGTRSHNLNYRIIPSVVCVIESKAVIVFEFASNERCATIRSENS